MEISNWIGGSSLNACYISRRCYISEAILLEFLLILGIKVGSSGSAMAKARFCYNSLSFCCAAVDMFLLELRRILLIYLTSLDELRLRSKLEVDFLSFVNGVILAVLGFGDDVR